MKKLILPIAIASLGIFSAACSDGLSVSEACEKVLACNPNAYASQQACEAQVQNETNLAGEACNAEINEYYECYFQKICDNDPNPKTACQDKSTLLNNCKAGM